MFQSKFGYSKINHENACLRLHKQTKHFCRSNTLYLAMTELVNRNRDCNPKSAKATSRSRTEIEKNWRKVGAAEAV